MKEKFTVPLQETNSIKLSRGMKGIYGWEIKLSGENEEEVLGRIELLDRKLTKIYVEEQSK